jgi:hypothetical protein
MDALKAEIASKRKALQQDDSVGSSRPTKYMRRGDIDRMKEEQKLKEREDKEGKEREEKEKAEEAATLKKASKMKVCILFLSWFKLEADLGMEDRCLQDQTPTLPYPILPT